MNVLQLWLLTIAFFVLALVRSSALSVSLSPRGRRSVLMAASSVPFVKYQGLGNDFILIDNTKTTNPIYTPEEAVKICDRNFGVGGK